MRAMLLRHLITLVAGAALLAGCSAEPVADADKIRIPNVSTPLGPEAAGNEPGEGAKPAKAKKRKKARRTVVVADESGIRFTLPPDWTVLGSGSVDYAADSPYTAEIAGKVGMSVPQFQELMRTVDVFALGFSGSLNVAVLGSTGALPPASALSAELAQLGPVGAARDVRTPLGTARIIPFTYELSGGTNQSATLFLVVRGRLVQVTAHTTDAGQTRSVIDGVARSLSRS